MKNGYGRVLHLAASVVVLLATGAVAGSLDPTNAPGPTMHTLEEIYQNQVQLLEKIDAYANPRMLSDTTTVMRVGYYLSNSLENVDGDLVTENIRSGITVFGVTGKTEVVDTTTGDATAGDILAGRKAWVDGSEVVGTVPTRALSDTTTVVNAGYYEGTTLSAVDADLAAENIKGTVEILGVTGVYGSSGHPAPVAKTGQTTSHRTGDDGDLQPGVAWPAPRFTDNYVVKREATVIDNLTGLMWTGNAVVSTNVVRWTDAIDFCNGLETAGHTDWRLPSVRELLSLVDSAYTSPSLCNTTGTGQWANGDPFWGVENSRFWTSTSRSDNPDMKAVVLMQCGTCTFLSKDIATPYVWMVRGGN